jgi:lipopolysaccharide export system protein LptA
MPGISLTVTARPIPGEPDKVRADWRASINTLKRRLPLEKVNLDVGKPIIESTQAASTVDFTIGQWMLLAGMAAKGVDAKSILVIGRISEPEADASEPNKGSLPPMDIKADKIDRLPNGKMEFTGNVRVSERGITLYADRLTFTHNPASQDGPGIRADEFSFDSPSGRIRLDGNALVRIPTGTVTGDRIVIHRSAQVLEKESHLMKKLKTIIIPVLDLRNVSLPDAIEFLKHVSIDQDPDGEGVNFVLMRKGILEKVNISISLKQVPLYEAIRYITEVGDVSFQVEDQAVVIK